MSSKHSENSDRDFVRMLNAIGALAAAVAMAAVVSACCGLWFTAIICASVSVVLCVAFVLGATSPRLS